MADGNLVNEGRILQALRQGRQRMRRTGKVWLWIYLLNLLLALTPALLLSGMIQDSLDHSLAAERLRSGWDDDWYREFRQGAQGLARTFQPSVAGMGAVLEAWDAFISGRQFSGFPGLVGLGVLYLLLWTFLAGGVIHLYNFPDPPTLETLMGTSARYFGRLFRLVIVTALAYAAIFVYLLPGLDGLVRAATRETIDERVVFVWTVLKYGLVLAVLIAVSLLSDYSKILIVTQSRRSILLSLLRATRLALTHPGKTVGLYLLIGALGVAVAALYMLIAPGVGETTWVGVLWAFLLGQAYILSRIWIRLLFWSSQSALCETLID